MELPPLYALAFAIGTTLVLLAVFRIGQRILSPNDAVAKSFAEENTARHLLHVGEVLGIFMVSAAVVKNCVQGQDLQHDLIWAGAFGVMGVILVAATGRLGTQLLLQSKVPD